LIDEAAKAKVPKAQLIDQLHDEYGITKEEFNRMIKNRDSFNKRYAKLKEKRVTLHNEDYGLIEKLGPIVGSLGNRDVTFAGWASTPESAEAYLQETGKVKDGWSFETRDLDNDGTREVLILDKDGVVRIVNGWGEKESRQPNRDDYYKHNPTISDRKNVTQIEWTRAVQVDPVGKIKYMYPKAVRYTKSRQQYYYDHEGKMPIADAKSVWQQYIAKPLLAMIMNQYADSFNVLDNLPGLASAALSQTFNSVGFMWFKIWVHGTIVGPDNVDEKLKQASAEMLSGGYYLEELQDKRKETNKTLSRLFEGVPNYEQKLRDLAVAAADSVSMGDIDWNNQVIESLRKLAVNSAKIIAQYYEGEIVDRPPSGLDRIRHHYLTGRQEKGHLLKR